MIHNFTFKNFYSFKEEGAVNFVVNEHAPKTDAYVSDNFDIRLNKIMTVIGPNASGKTNAFKVVPFLKWFILDSFKERPTKGLLFHNFRFDTSTNKKSEFIIKYEQENKIYEYTLVANTMKVFIEKLTVTEKIKERNSTKILFGRSWNDEKQKYIYDFKNFNISSGFESLMRDNASIISTALQIKHNLSIEIATYWQNINTNVSNHGKLDADLIFESAKFYFDNPHFKERAEDIISRLDFGISEIKIEKILFNDDSEDSKDNFIYAPFGIHKTNDTIKYRLPFMMESSGTQNLFCILTKILLSLDTGGILIFDEFDCDLHPFMVPELLNLFKSDQYNPKNAQILFATHNVHVLATLDKYQINLVEKNENGVSEIWRLDSLEGVRPDDNYYSKYIAGAYGAVPNL